MPSRPCATGPVKFAHLCEIDYRTNVGSPAWFARHNAAQRRVSALRYAHLVGGTHEAARAMVMAGMPRATSLKQLQTRVIADRTIRGAGP